jgi:uncharacterized membrane protein required for colicin V production
MNLDALPINLFDFVVVGVLVVGVMRGRKHGMSEELLGVLKWVAVLAICALGYEPLGRLFAQSSKVFSTLTCYLLAYIGIGLVILTVFALVKRGLGGKLLGSDIFGQAEYPLGMGSGLLRFTCMLLAALALLNARYFSPTEVRAMEKFQDDVYGSNFFPTLHTLQSTVFERSLTGPWIKDHLSFLLIKPTEPENKEIKQKEYVFPK